MFSSCFSMVLCLAVLASEPPPVQTVPSYKKLESQYITLNFTGVNIHEARSILDESDLFVGGLEDLWGIRLENLKMTMALSADHTQPSEGTYVRSKKYAFLRVKRFEPRLYEKELHKVILLALVNQRDSSLPLYYQVGISQYFSESYPADMDLMATFALLKHPQISDFLRNKDSYEKEPFYFSVLSTLFVEKLWEQDRVSFVKWMQFILGGSSTESALADAGLGRSADLLKNFDHWAKTYFSIDRLLLFPSLWRMFISILICLGFLIHLWRSWRRSSLPILVLKTTAPENQEDAIEFEGPVFSGLDQDADDEPSFPPRTVEAKVLGPESAKKTTKSRKGKILHVHPSGADLDQPLPREKNAEFDEASLQSAVEAIDQDLDDFFDLPIKNKDPKAKSGNNESNDFKDLDDFIDEKLDF